MSTKKTPLSSEQILGLIAMAVAVLVIANDFTALSVALPAMEAAFSTDVTTVQWVITGYALVFGVLIVSGGRLADMFRRRRIFFIGAAIFVTFSMLGGLATDIWMLIIARGVMGVGGALMWSAVLGMTYGLLPMMGTFALVSFLAGTLYEQLGAKTVIAAGAAWRSVCIYYPASSRSRVTPRWYRAWWRWVWAPACFISRSPRLQLLRSMPRVPASPVPFSTCSRWPVAPLAWV